MQEGSKLQHTSIQFVGFQAGSALQASSIQDDTLLVVGEHVACLEALHQAVLSATVPLADLAVHLQHGLGRVMEVAMMQISLQVVAS